MTGVDLMRPNPLPQPMLGPDRTPGTAQIKDVQVVTETGLHVTSIYAGGSGWAPHKIGEVAWDSAEFSVSLEGPDRPEQIYRYGADVASGAAAAMFAIFLSALENGRPVDVASYSPGNDAAPVVLGVAMSGD